MTHLLGRIVNVVTADGVTLHGFQSEPKHSTESIWVFVHGVNSNFYKSTLISELSCAIAERGAATLSINTRGHDLLGFNSGPTPMKQGSQCETVAHCVHDLYAWIGWLEREGYRHIVLVGHSLGAVKSTFWLASSHEPSAATSKPQYSISGFVALSPPRLNTQLLLSDPSRGEVFQRHLAEATQYCEDDRPEHVMKVRFPMPMWICAATYLEKYGSGDRFDYVYLFPKITCPTLWTFGQNEVENGSLNFLHADRTLAESINAQPDFESVLVPRHSVQVIPGADHSYHGTRLELIHRIDAWTKTHGTLRY